MSCIEQPAAQLSKVLLPLPLLLALIVAAAATRDGDGGRCAAAAAGKAVLPSAAVNSLCCAFLQ